MPVKLPVTLPIKVGAVTFPVKVVSFKTVLALAPKTK